MERDLTSIKEEIRARVDLVELIGGYTHLKRTGKNWTGLCPFHNDRKPSFSVSPTLGIYKCYSCGEGGDLFKFVQKKENLEFIEAIEFLAQRAGVAFERKGASPELQSEREQMLELNALAVAFYQDRLAKSADARDYLAGRALLKSTQEQWDIGYAPPEWEGLTFHLQKQRANLELAAKMGLLKTRKGDGGGYYDTFRHRLIFPIHDLNGRVVAFGGRAMSADEPAKYLNSEQSLLFDKSRTLYGLYFAKKKIGGDTPPVFVEGYVDVITSHQAGFTQCVATLGTSMTEEHARLLARYAPRVLICYDGDAAGIKATLRGAAVWEAMNLEGGDVRVARLPAGDDPDSLLKRGEMDVFQKALDNAVPRVEFQLELALKNHDLSGETGRDAALAEVIPILASVANSTQRSRYLLKVAYLHPLYNTNTQRAESLLLTDVERYASVHAKSARSNGYPLSEQANGQPLAENPPAPAYKRPTSDDWGRMAPPYTENVVAPGETHPDKARNPHAPNQPNQTESRPSPYRKSNWQRGEQDPNTYKKWGAGETWAGGGRRFQRDPPKPPSDLTPVPLDIPPLTGAEKVERQLLRALFTAEWRVQLLGNAALTADLWITPQARRLHALIAQTPALPDGSIDARALLYRLESEEDAKQSENIENLVHTETMDIGASTPLFTEKTEAGGATNAPKAKLSVFIREMLQDSDTLSANEPLNETVIAECLRRLQKQRDERDKRGLRQLMQDIETLPLPEQQAIIGQYHAKMRVMRGSPPGAEDES